MTSRLVKFILVAVFGLIIIIPVTMVVLTTVKTSEDFYMNPIGIPNSFTMQNMIQLFIGNHIHLNLLNSLIVTISTVFLCLLVASFISYVIMRLKGWRSLLLFGLFILGMFLPAQVNMIPLYGVVNALGLNNSLFGLILISTTSFMSVVVFIVAGFMKTIPKSLIEASVVDGASEWQIYRKVVMPLSAPSIATAAIFVSVMVWNDLLYPLLFIVSPEKKTLPLALLDFQGEYFTNYPMIFSGVIIASIPMIIVYLFMQRYFMEGITAGSNKG
ncbi:carbohydrate ABC transporter permease [Oceanobacillus piezotolerans]|uniref:Carbohydrate ABC transporter permease n=1 Tax=Oceanobacillus piezotolerans TaxID=2448030 RepID=A0A498D2P0_9BACI|nr:carbohydrate ABC transporter permease [Oceanobacillus piezotolerans]RLL41148.1 carbohydrate ABC transporter permease [Oceanobacillus piezotolerans]